MAECWGATECANTVGTRASSFGDDTGGNLTSMNNSASRTFNFSYDGAWQLATESNTYAATSPNIVTQMVTSATYYPSGQPQAMTMNTGSATVTGTWGVDKRFRTTSYVNQSTANSGYTNYGYTLTYDSHGNVKTSAETVYNPGTGATPWSWTSNYDTLNRLSNSLSSGSIQWGCAETYDAWGNRIAQNPYSTGRCTMNATPVLPNTNNRLSGSQYVYDLAGNMLSDGTNTLTYDAEGRIATSTQGSNTTTYVYGADGQRVGKINGGTETNYVHDLNGSLVATYVNASYNTQPQEMWLAGRHFGTVVVSSGGSTQTQTFSLGNWLGSEAARTNSSTGIPTAAFVSQPFGDFQTTLFGSDADDIHFTGKERDAESGNDYFGARYYSSNNARFMSPDPYGGSMALTNPQTLNRYSYVLNNPSIFTDPSGLDCVFLNSEGNGIEEVDSDLDTSPTECTSKSVGGYYVPGHLTGYTTDTSDPNSSIESLEYAPFETNADFTGPQPDYGSSSMNLDYTPGPLSTSQLKSLIAVNNLSGLPDSTIGCIVGIESGGNPQAVALQSSRLSDGSRNPYRGLPYPGNTAKGLMQMTIGADQQIMTMSGEAAAGAQSDSFNPAAAISTGTDYIAYLVRRYGAKWPNHYGPNEQAECGNGGVK